MIKYLFSIVLFTSTIVFAIPWMPWDSGKSDNSSGNLSGPWIPWGANSQTKTTSIVNEDEKYTKGLSNQLFEQSQDYSNAKIEAYYEGLANYYNKVKGQNDYYGYKSTGYFDYMPGAGNSFPAPVSDSNIKRK